MTQPRTTTSDGGGHDAVDFFTDNELLHDPLDRTIDIRIDEGKHGLADNRHYSCLPTFILRGPTRLHIESS